MSTTTTPATTNGQSEPPVNGLKKMDPRARAFKELFESEKFQTSLKQVMPQHLKPERIVRVVLSAMTGNPELLECTPETLMLSLMRAAAMGLEPDGGALAQGYLVPFNVKVKQGGMEVWQKQCQFIPGYRGLVKLARNSGEVADVWAEVVYEKDAFDYDLGLDQALTHKRNDEVADPGPLKYAYAVARFRDGEKKFVVMNKREVEKVRASSKSGTGKYSPWNAWEEEMWKKTAVRRLCKLLPLSVESARAIGIDDESEGTRPVDLALPDIELPERVEDQSGEANQASSEQDE